jgi:hypothetical protein
MKYTILCEDAQSQCFIRHFLHERHIKRHDIRELPVPGNRGCGEQWVRERYPAELENLRKHPVNLIVCTDADTGSVVARVKRLDGECVKCGVAPRTSSDTAAYIIPKRNIETWIAFLNGQPVNENTNYGPPKHAADKRRCAPAAKKLNADCMGFRNNPPLPPNPPFPPSLQTACAEVKRIGL